MDIPLETFDTLIVGGGLSGVYAAYLLSRTRASFLVLEARKRIGGRVLCSEYQGYATDLGPSWYWPEIQPNMARLIQMLGLEGYRQFEEGLGRFQFADGAVRTVRGYAMEPRTWRLSGGMMALIRRLREEIPENAVRCNHPVCRIEKRTEGVRVSVGERVRRMCSAASAIQCELRMEVAGPQNSNRGNAPSLLLSSSRSSLGWV